MSTCANAVYTDRACTGAVWPLKYGHNHPCASESSASAMTIFRLNNVMMALFHGDESNAP